MTKDKPPSFADALAEINKKYRFKAGSLSDVADEVTGLTTGNLAIDYITGVGGIPRGRITELYGQPSSGKAQPLDALVLTPDGYVKMGELKIGQAVTDPDGGYSHVTGIFPQGVQSVYQLRFSDGSTAEATGDHLWNVEVYVPAFGFLPATVTTDQLAARVRCSAGRPRVRLVPIEPVVFRGAEPGTPNRRYLPLRPYLLGLLIGDGTFDRAISFTTKDPELLDAVRNLVPDECEVRPASEKHPGITWRINGLASYIRDLGLGGLHAEAKFVPELYKHQPVGDRLALLQGLMDTDGHASSGQYNAGHGVGEFSSASRQLRDDAVWLARSLGLKAVVGKTKKASYRNQAGELVACKDSYRARIYQTEQVRVFRLARKRKPVQPGLHYNRELVSVEYVRDAQCQCISVSAESELYVTNDFIPTHNTTTALQCASILQYKIITEGTDDHILYLDFEHALDGDYCAALGLDVNHPSFILVQPNWLEQGAEISEKLITTGKVRLSIWDSVAEMTPQELEFGIRTNAMERARLMKGLLQRHNSLFHETDCAGVFLNHMVEAVTMTGRPGMPPVETSPGGVALKFYSSLRLAFKQIGQKRGKAPNALTGEVVDQIIATHVKVKATKNKVGIPLREAELRVRFGRGFDEVWSALQVLVSHRRVPKMGAFYFFDKLPGLIHADMPRTSTGRAHLHSEQAVLTFADEHPDWRDGIIAEARATVAQFGAGEAVPEDETDIVSEPSMDSLLDA